MPHGMTKRDAAVIAIAGRRSARRTGNYTFLLDPKKMRGLGFNERDIGEIEKCADDIETYTEQRLVALDR